ncbi:MULTISPECIES: Imm1 family immunity protein [unclassified Micromonospora]
MTDYHGHREPLPDPGRAVAEYAATGRRPTCLTWQAEHQ